MIRPKMRDHSILRRMFFLDVLLDRRTRPILIYIAAVIVSGAAIYHWLEGWSWLDATYFVVITIATIGYGDLTPTMPITKLITIFYGLNGIIVLLTLFDIVRRVRHLEVTDRPADTGRTRQT